MPSLPSFGFFLHLKKLFVSRQTGQCLVSNYYRCCSSFEKTDPSADARELVANSRVRGMDIIRDPMTNKGLAFSLEERQIMGIHGLLPPSFFSQEDQVHRAMKNFYRFDNDLDKFSYIMSMKDRNERLFYRVVQEHVELLMPIIYTPTVGLACQKYGLIYTYPRGLYITVHDLGRVYELLCNWPYRDIRAVVVTDGERILGLGDLGAYGMGIPVGKLSLYTAIGGFEPRKCLPVCIDAGTNNTQIRNDPLYIGLREPRNRSDAYFELVDEFMSAVAKKWGQDTLIQFEDFANRNAFVFLEKYIDKYLTFNDDIQGTAAVAVAGILAAMRITETKVSDNTFLFQGAGQAATGIANLLVMAMESEGVSHAEACSKIWMVDIDGLLVKTRELKHDHDGEEHLDRLRRVYVKDYKHMTDLEEIIRDVKPSAIFGLSTVRGAFTDKIIQHMAEINERPIIFALSNPTDKAECTAEEAYTYSDGRAVFASGSPFKSVTINGKTFTPGQGNNAYIFPAVALSAVLFKARHIPEAAFLHAAKYLAELVEEEDLDKGLLFTPLEEIRETSIIMAAKLGDYFYSEGLALKYPEPKDKEKFVRSSMWDPSYDNFIPETYDWPKSAYPQSPNLF